MTRRRLLVILVALLVAAGAALAVVQAQLQQRVERSIARAVAELPPAVQLRYQAVEVGWLARSVVVRDIAVRLAGQQAPIEIEQVRLLDYDSEHRVPHFLRAEIDGVRHPLAALPVEQAEALRELGYARLHSRYRIDYRYEPETRALRLRELRGEVGGLAAVGLSLELRALDLAQAVEQAPGRMPEFSVAGGRFLFEDEVLVSRLIAKGAERDGVDTAVFRAQLIAAVRARLRNRYAPFFRQLEDALEQMVREPRSTLVVTAAPARPVPVYELIAAAFIHPAGVPDILGLAVRVEQSAPSIFPSALAQRGDGGVEQNSR